MKKVLPVFMIGSTFLVLEWSIDCDVIETLRENLLIRPKIVHSQIRLRDRQQGSHYYYCTITPVASKRNSSFGWVMAAISSADLPSSSA